MAFVFNFQTVVAFFEILVFRLETGHLLQKGIILSLRELQGLGPLIPRLARYARRLTDALHISILSQAFFLEDLPGSNEKGNILGTQMF
jgi:hypothetical protein